MSEQEEATASEEEIVAPVENSKPIEEAPVASEEDAKEAAEVEGEATHTPPAEAQEETPGNGEQKEEEEGTTAEAEEGNAEVPDGDQEPAVAAHEPMQPGSTVVEAEGGATTESPEETAAVTEPETQESQSASPSPEFTAASPSPAASPTGVGVHFPSLLDDTPTGNRRDEDRDLSLSRSAGSKMGSSQKNWSGVFGSSQRSSRVVLPDLEAKPVVPPAFDNQFRDRLKSISTRNNDQSLCHVMGERDKILESHYMTLIRKGEEAERRHREAEETHKKILKEKKWMENQVRTKLWIEAMVATISATTFFDKISRHRSLEKLKAKFLPMLQRKLHVLMKRRERRLFTEEHLEENPRPTASQLIAMGAFFKDWTLKELDDLIRHMTPRSYHKGECIMHDGDFDREMYVLVKGGVNILLRDKEMKSKKRNPGTSKKVIPLPSNSYFGEFALLCMEPRSATIQCSEDCHLWVVSQSDFARELEFLSAEVRAKLQTTADDRRKKNLQQYFPLRIEVLLKQPFFAHWDTNVLHEVIGALSPHVLRPGTVLYTEGDYQPVMYIIGEGTVTLYKESDPSVKQDFIAGECIGVFETMFTHERRPMTAKTKTHCDLWSITRHQLADIAMSDPMGLIRSKKIVQDMKAACLTKSVKPPPFFANDPYIQWMMPPFLQQTVWSEAEPKVFCANEVLCREGEDTKGIFVIGMGTFAISFGAKGLEEYSEEISINPQLGGVHSSLNSHNDNLAMLFPAVTLVTPPDYTGEGEGAPTSPTYMRAASDVSAFIFSKNDKKHDQLTSPTHATSGSGHMIGMVVGSFETVARRSRYQCTIKCLSQCDVWLVRKETIENAMSSKLHDANLNPTSISFVIEAHNKLQSPLLYHDYHFKPSTHYNTHHVEQRKMGGKSSPLPTLAPLTSSQGGGAARTPSPVPFSSSLGRGSPSPGALQLKPNPKQGMHSSTAGTRRVGKSLAPLSNEKGGRRRK